jgi:hypothetical protein
VILVDNGSDDGSPDADRGAFPHVTVVRLAENRGAAARNVGVELARTRTSRSPTTTRTGRPARSPGRHAAPRPCRRSACSARGCWSGREARIDPVSAAMAAAPLGVRDGPRPGRARLPACSVAVRREAFPAGGWFNPRCTCTARRRCWPWTWPRPAGCWLTRRELIVRHLPLPAGRDNGARHRIEARNRVLTALLRRPPAVVARTGAGGLAGRTAAGWPTRRACSRGRCAAPAASPVPEGRDLAIGGGRPHRR